LRGETSENFEASEIELPGIEPADDLFAVRVSGDSMNGGKNPIRDGDWVVLRWARGRSLAEMEGRVALFEVRAGDEAAEYLLKRLVRDSDGLHLRSDNSDHPAIRAAKGIVPIAAFRAVVPHVD
jgi:phage repressor protein C with HTH and peptisase S24 domain